MSKLTVKAGRYLFDKETKKVKVSRDKGLITLSRKEDETHFSWANLDTHVEQIDLIVFPSDAVFQTVPNKNNTYVLRFQTDEDRYFFWFQEKVDVEQTINKINNFINTMQQQQMKQEPKEQKPQKMDIQKPVEPVAAINTTNKPAVSDFIKRMQENIQAANKNKGKPITHLGDILTSQAINILLKQTPPDDLKTLVEHLPEQQQDEHFLSQNIRSPQYLQAMDALTDALNSENAIALFMQLGLNQQYLHRYYGVQAFIRALQQWGEKQKK